MKDRSSMHSPGETLEAELQQQLDTIRDENVPERLLELARQLQAHLRHRQTFED